MKTNTTITDFSVGLMHQLINFFKNNNSDKMKSRIFEWFCKKNWKIQNIQPKKFPIPRDFAVIQKTLCGTQSWNKTFWCRYCFWGSSEIWKKKKGGENWCHWKNKEKTNRMKSQIEKDFTQAFYLSWKLSDIFSKIILRIGFLIFLIRIFWQHSFVSTIYHCYWKRSNPQKE